MPIPPYADPAARAGELLRLQIFLEQPGLTADAIRLYAAERLEQVYPLDYHVYRRRWRALPPGEEPGPLLGFLEWYALVSQLQERAAFAELWGETAEGEAAAELRRVLLVDGGETEPQEP